MGEDFVSFESGGLALHGILRKPQNPLGIVVICDAFAEEKKCSHRPLVEIARALGQAGYATLRFDYRGCGDSEGEFNEFTLVDWQEDILTALKFTRQKFPASLVFLAGLRLGATLAEHAACKETVDGLILWEPIWDGKRYVSLNLRRSMVKAMLTDGDEFNVEQVQNKQVEDLVDFDGYLLNSQLQKELEAMILPSMPAPAMPVLVLQIGPRDEPGAGYVTLARSYLQGEVAAVRVEPFWNRIGLIDAGPVAQRTVEWLAKI